MCAMVGVRHIHPVIVLHGCKVMGEELRGMYMATSSNSLLYNSFCCYCIICHLGHLIPSTSQYSYLWQHWCAFWIGLNPDKLLFNFVGLILALQFFACCYHKGLVSTSGSLFCSFTVH